MTTFKCSVTGCNATDFTHVTSQISEKLKGTPAALNFRPLRVLCCSNGHPFGVDYSNEFAELKRQLDLLIQKPGK